MGVERPTYAVKNRSESLIIFKFLKLAAIFLGAWTGLWFIMVFFVGRRRRGAPIPQDLFDVFWNIALYGALAAVLYYIFLKVRNKQVDKVVFDYDLKVINITYKSYFLHIKSIAKLSFDGIDSTIVSKQSFLYGEHHVLSIFHQKKRVAYIGAASSDWQKLPNFLVRMNERIQDIRAEKAVKKG